MFDNVADPLEPTGGQDIYHCPTPDCSGHLGAWEQCPWCQWFDATRWVATCGVGDRSVEVVVGCGSSKADEPAAACDLYTSSYFSSKRMYAELADDWKIMSAEHGLVRPETELEPYDMHPDHDDFDRDEYVARLGSQIARGAFDDADLVVLILSMEYTALFADAMYEAYEQITASADPFYIVEPFEHINASGMGDQMGWMKQQYADA